MKDTRAFSLFLAFEQGYVFLSNSTFHKVFEKIYLFSFEIFSVFCVTRKFVRNLLTSSAKWGDGEGDVPLKAQLAYLFKTCETFLSKKLRTETSSWKNQHTREKFRRLSQFQSHFCFYVTMEIWLQRFHFVPKHFWLSSAEKFVNSSAIGKKLIENTQNSFCRHSET